MTVIFLSTWGVCKELAGGPSLWKQGFLQATPGYMLLLCGEDLLRSALLLDICPRGGLLVRLLLIFHLELSLQYLLGRVLLLDLYLQQRRLSAWLRKERGPLLDIFLLWVRLCAGMDRANCLDSVSYTHLRAHET